MTEKKKLNLRDIIDLVAAKLLVLRRYSLIIFIVFVASLYGFLVFRISTLSNAQPSQDAVSSQVKKAKVPHIDESVVKQLQSLEDNSVNVKTLFNQARNNPFQ